MPEQKQLTEDELQNLSQDELLALFVEQLLVDKGEEATDNLRANLSLKISDRINLGILHAMPDEMLDKVNEALDDPNVSDEEIEKMISESGVDIAKVTSEAMTAFRNEYLGEESNNE